MKSALALALVLLLENVVGRNCQCRSRPHEIETVLDVTPPRKPKKPSKVTIIEKEPMVEKEPLVEPTIEIVPRTAGGTNLNSCSFEVESGVTGTVLGSI